MSIQVALAGNPNCGKTTLFNGLTGATQYVGNWPGVTVEKKEGKYKEDKDIKITDLPGIYSLSPYTLEEVVSREFLLNGNVDVILNIIDGSNLERNLFLTTQLLELGIPTVVAINMLDVIEKRKDTIDYKKLSKELECPVLPISALKNTGIKELMVAVKKAANTQCKPKNIYAGKVLNALNTIETSLPTSIDTNRRFFYAVKLFERDDKIEAAIKTSADASVIEACEKSMDDDSESIITDARYTYITNVIKDCYKKGSKEVLTTSDKIDRIVTNRILALPIFALVMWFVYYISVTTVGTIVTDWTNDVLFGEIIPPAVDSFLTSIQCADWLHGLIVDGIIGPWFLEPWQKIVHEGYEVHYIILKASKEKTIQRAITRSKLDRETNIELVEVMWEQFDNLGIYEKNVIDTTNYSIIDTVSAIKDKIFNKVAILH